MLEINNATMGDYGAIVAIEMMGVRLQAGTPEVIQDRIAKQNDTFLVARDDQRVVGLIVGAVSKDEFIHDAMYKQAAANEATGGHQLVLGIAQAANYGDQELSAKLLAAFEKVARAAHRETMSLLSLEKDIPFYEKNGFQRAGVSDVKHGGNTWYNMVKKL